METELKLQVAEPKCWQAILDFLPTLDGGGEIQSGRFRAIYYDTPKGDLTRLGYVARITTRYLAGKPASAALTVKF